MPVPVIAAKENAAPASSAEVTPHFIGGATTHGSSDRFGEVYVSSTMRIYREEIFGPLLSIVWAPNYDAALSLANENPFGSDAAIFTRDGGAARDFAHRVKAGMVGVNVAIPVPMAFHSFGGWKRSLFGDHYVHGAEGVRFCKTITQRWPEATLQKAEFQMPVHEWSWLMARRILS